ncbi:MAG: rhomboid family intramembrane serine protease [Simkaniaceae bacterium]|nr:rhomboid family intramembrane serine protease [Candidatus Sacchlamyda saccharinae]
MRLIGHLENEKQAFVFYSFLLTEGIHSTYEKTNENVAIWIYEEDATEVAQQYLQEFIQNPSDPKYAKVDFPKVPPQPPDLIAEEKETETRKVSLPPETRKIRSYPLTYFVIFLCVLLYFLNSMQQYKMVQEDGPVAVLIGMTPIQQHYMFDYPEKNQKIDALLKDQNFKQYKELEEVPVSTLKPLEQIPSWQGILSLALGAEDADGPMFTKIREGQIWRLLTPIFLHGGLLHILFNMAWAWILLRQVEERLSRFKILLFILIVGVVSNVCQYLISGPYFLGFSGVVIGLVGFIWARQKTAPWEGYPLNRTTFTFVLIYLFAMVGLEILSLVSSLVFAKEISVGIANTAHIVGGVTGYLLGRINFFSRGAK